MDNWKHVHWSMCVQCARQSGRGRRISKYYIIDVDNNDEIETVNGIAIEESSELGNIKGNICSQHFICDDETCIASSARCGLFVVQATGYGPHDSTWITTTHTPRCKFHSVLHLSLNISHIKIVSCRCRVQCPMHFAHHTILQTNFSSFLAFLSNELRKFIEIYENTRCQAEPANTGMSCAYARAKWYQVAAVIVGVVGDCDWAVFCVSLRVFMANDEMGELAAKTREHIFSSWSAVKQVCLVRSSVLISCDRTSAWTSWTQRSLTFPYLRVPSKVWRRLNGRGNEFADTRQLTQIWL